MNHDSRWMTVAGFLAMAAAVAVWAADGATPAALAGRWTLNRSLTQTPKREGGSSFHFGAGRGGGRRGGPGPGGEEAGPREDRGAREDRDAGPVRLAGVTDLMVDSSDGTLRLVGGDGHVRLLYTDGRTVEQDSDRGPRTESTVWRDGQAVVTTTGPRTTVTETFALSGDGGGRLVHTVRVERKNAKEPLVFRWVYDRAVRPK